MFDFQVRAFGQSGKVLGDFLSGQRINLLENVINFKNYLRNEDKSNPAVLSFLKVIFGDPGQLEVVLKKKS